MIRKIVPDVVKGQELLALPATATVREAACAMQVHNVGAVLIATDERLEGIFTERDLVNRVVAVGRDPDHTPLSDVMTEDPDTVGPNATAIDALRRMEDAGYRHLPVTENGRLVGIVSRRDFSGTEKARLEQETALWHRL